MSPKQTQGENKNISPKKKKRPAVRNTRPDGFADTEKMARDLLNAKGVNYYEWLDELHKKVILKEVTSNREKVVSLIVGD